MGTGREVPSEGWPHSAQTDVTPDGGQVSTHNNHMLQEKLETGTIGQSFEILKV